MMQHHKKVWIYNGKENVPPTVRRVKIELAEGITKIPDYAFEEHSVNSVATSAFSICSVLGVSAGSNANISVGSTTSGNVFPKLFKAWQFGGEADLIRRWNHRFDKSPLNKLCYYHSYHHSCKSAMARLRSLMEAYPPLAATTQVDVFGMTPLHVLSLSQTANMGMLLAVMDAGKPGHMAVDEALAVDLSSRKS
eukprot:scaffold3042_cov101-Cylindrotheca_fusiformis.AAC.1